MVLFLPPQPNLDHLKNEAKALQKAHQNKDPGVCEVLRHLHRVRDVSDERILSASVPLTEAQFALAMEYGFADWQELRDAVLSIKPAADYAPEAEGDAMILPNPPAGLGGGHWFPSAFSLALTYLGAAADPPTVAGDSGLAFILQADSLHHPYDTDIPQLDMGWWPLDSWGAELRLGFLGEAAGIGLRVLPKNVNEYRADPALHYRKYHETEVTASLRAGRPAIAVTRDLHVVFGGDGGNPPLLGQLSCETNANLQRLGAFPWHVIVLDEPGEPMSRREADRAALDFAVRLSRDEVDLGHLPGKSAGVRSWELWLAQLRDPELCGPHFYHANVVGHLWQNRTAAVAYLKAMAGRHEESVASRLLNAARTYEKVLEELQKANTSKEAFATGDGRGELVKRIERMAGIESEAIAEIEQALATMA
ncbi:MAG TPA: hypothetical protein HPP83_01145 [Candidatus Hydrogenedentes bacterium]|nr:hypothetical protein [Candidatus Hydrogenedentota bacterium]